MRKIGEGVYMNHLTLTVKNLYSEGNEKLWNVIANLTQHQLMDIIMQLDEVKDYELIQFLYDNLEYCAEV